MTGPPRRLALRRARAVGAIDACDLFGRNSHIQCGRARRRRQTSRRRRRSATMTSHQICQIMREAAKVAKNAQTKPVGLFRGISMACSPARLSGLPRARQALPCASSRLDPRPGQDGEIERRRRRCRRPFERAAHPGSPVTIAQLLAMANAHDELRDLTQMPARMTAAPRPRPAARDAMREHRRLHPAGHAHQAQHIERHEGNIEADQPAPERSLARPSCRRKPNAFGNQ